MKKKNKICTSILAVTAASILFAGSINAQIVSGYESFKDSVRKTVYLNNATVDAQMYMKVNGKEISNDKSLTKLDRKSDSSERTYYYTDGNGNVQKNVQYNTPTLMISTYLDENGTLNYSVYEHSANQFDNENRNLLGAPDEMINIMELCADAFTGSAKEYVVKEETDGGYTLSGNFDKTQVPEIGNALVNLMISESKRSMDRMSGMNDYTVSEDSMEGVIYNNNVTSGYINNLILDSAIDEKGCFDYVNIASQLMLKSADGKEFPIEMSVKVKITDKGTTTINLPAVNKDDENVSWSTDRGDVVQNEESNKVMEQFYEQQNKTYDILFSGDATDEDRQRVLKAIEAFERALNEGVEAEGQEAPEIAPPVAVEQPADKDTVVQTEKPESNEPADAPEEDTEGGEQQDEPTEQSTEQADNPSDKEANTDL